MMLGYTCLEALSIKSTSPSIGPIARIKLVPKTSKFSIQFIV